jgi:hypothetical protein
MNTVTHKDSNKFFLDQNFEQLDMSNLFQYIEKNDTIAIGYSNELTDNEYDLHQDVIDLLTKQLINNGYTVALQDSSFGSFNLAQSQIRANKMILFRILEHGVAYSPGTTFLIDKVQRIAKTKISVKVIDIESRKILALENIEKTSTNVFLSKNRKIIEEYDYFDPLASKQDTVSVTSEVTVVKEEDEEDFSKKKLLGGTLAGIFLGFVTFLYFVTGV